jgi:hypothetical protein
LLCWILDCHKFLLCFFLLCLLYLNLSCSFSLSFMWWRRWNNLFMHVWLSFHTCLVIFSYVKFTVKRKFNSWVSTIVSCLFFPRLLPFLMAY